MCVAVAFVVYGKAAPAGSKTSGVSKAGRRFVRDSNPASRQWKDLVSQVAGVAMSEQELLEGPLKLRAVFYQIRPQNHYGSGKNSDKLKPSAPTHPTSAPDATKLLRAVEDAMQGIVYRNDSQIVHQEVWKEYGSPARVEIEVTPI